MSEDDEPTAEQLRAKYGWPERVDTARFLAMFGPVPEAAEYGEVLAFRYPSTEAAEAFADGNKRHGGYESLGPVVTDDGVFGAVILPGSATPYRS